jgi:hypothetical protein
MVRLADKPSIYLELYGALAHFRDANSLPFAPSSIRRKSIRPPARCGGVGDKAPQVGQWGDEWRFFFHGGGLPFLINQTS